MIAFQCQLAHNQYLARGADLVHAVLSIAATPDVVGSATGRTLVEGFIVDCSGSMEGEKIRNARAATEAAIELLREDAWFFIVGGSNTGTLVFSLAQASPQNKALARAAVRKLKANGGTVMSTWLRLALQEFQKKPGTIHHALMLTDGRNDGEAEAKLTEILEKCEGEFQCDVRGVGTDWRPNQLRLISGKLLGTLDLIPKPTDIQADFARVIESALGKAVADVFLRLWTPVGASVEFCKLVYPEKVDLTPRGRQDANNPRVRDYPTGAWGEEKRDYHICLRVKPGNLGQRMCAGRASLVLTDRGQETKVSETMILVLWTDDEAQSAIINPAVAHYTGQAELAEVIQQGLKARATGNEVQATALLGRAVQIAAQTNPETMKLLRRVVQIEDERQGTVRLLKGVNKEDEFALDTRSMRTARLARD